MAIVIPVEIAEVLAAADRMIKEAKAIAASLAEKMAARRAAIETFIRPAPPSDPADP